MRKNDVFVWLVILILIGGQITTQYRIARNERALVGVMLLSLAGNTGAKNLVHDMARNSTIKDKNTRNLLARRTMNKYVPKSIFEGESVTNESKTY